MDLDFLAKTADWLAEGVELESNILSQDFAPIVTASRPHGRLRDSAVLAISYGRIRNFIALTTDYR